MTEPFELTAYQVSDGTGVEMLPAPIKRDWMDATIDRFAYRCLPLNIAASSGWWLTNPVAFRAMWIGGDPIERLIVEPLEEDAKPIAESHFGSGILTFGPPWLFRTPPGWNLRVGGPVNYLKDGIAPLEGIVETDWATATFTMNWRFTATNQWVIFERGEPFCQISPVRRGDVELFTPVERDIDDSDFADVYRAWGKARDEFNAGLRDGTADEKAWQGHYARGQSIDYSKAPEHQTKIKLRPLLRRDDADAAVD
jgi:hypothetical protein